MPVHGLSNLFDSASGNQLLFGAAGLLGVVGIKAWSGGRKCTWERDWAGKMILIIVCPVPCLCS